MQKKTNSSSIPKGRLSRLGKLSSLAGRVAGNMFAEGVSEFAKGNRPKIKDLLLTPGNAMRVADQLAQMRGAAMKVGQMISMDAGDMLPAELTDLLARLRSDAKSMPEKELINLLESEWGISWQKKFIQFPLQPIAAASIGQVHKVITQDLKRLAIKIQYPGIKKSINSDVDNVSTLIKMTGLLPKGLDITPLLTEAKKQLHDEADYALEGHYLEQYAAVVEDDDAFVMPVLDKEFSSDTILAMSFVDGIPIEQLVDASQQTRDQVMSHLMRLFFKELFDFQLVQTDPNFANYQYDQDTHKIVLLDFGATRIYTSQMAESYRQLMQGANEHDKTKIHQAILDIGLIGEDLPEKVQQNITDLAYAACEPLYGESPYDFAASDLSSRLQHQGMQLKLEKEYAHTPSANAIFLHRKLGGLFLLAIKLKAKVDMQTLFAPYIKA
ncbi:MAG: putative unusual protein kinase regulating ubiquinone biosynthesis (AarF/ABC1/UbiB family) [Paraglaciecola sp.]|jgi:predicted unusual protein kinase regulating ubiquinone biosynthesis (AarF/ABC1/UbiB family)